MNTTNKRRANPTGLRCPKCKSTQQVRDGIHRRWKGDKGKQRWRCWNCGSTTIAPLPGRTSKKASGT